MWEKYKNNIIKTKITSRLNKKKQKKQKQKQKWNSSKRKWKKRTLDKNKTKFGQK